MNGLNEIRKRAQRKYFSSLVEEKPQYQEKQSDVAYQLNHKIRKCN